MKIIAAITVLSALGFSSNQSPISRSFSFEGGKVDALGVCNITPETVACWNMDGASDERLENLLREYYSTRSNQINFQFGKKNRILVASKPPQAYVNFTSGSDRHISNSGEIESAGLGQVTFLNIATDPTEKSIDINVMVGNLPGPKAVELPFKVGSKVTYAGTIYEVGKWTKSDPETANRMFGYWGGPGPRPKQSFWRLVMGAQTIEGGQDYWSSSFVPLDSSRQPIPYVDDRGQPVSAVKFMEETRGNQGMPQPVSSKYSQVVFQNQDQNQGAMAMTTNIDPAKIAYLRIYKGRSEKGAIGTFPLDPK